MLAYTSKVFYKVGKTMYLDEPHWEPAEGSGVVLLGNNPIRKMEYYLDQHPEIAFATYKEYREAPPAGYSRMETKDGIYRSPKPTHEYLSLIAPDMIEAVEEFVQAIPQFSDYFPYFDSRRNIVAPYLFMYYSAPFLHEVVPEPRIPNQNLIKQLHAVIQDSYGGEYHSARLQADKDHIQSKLIPRYGPLANPGSSHKLNTWVWEVPVWYWKFDGTYAKHETRVNVVMSLGYEEESVEIRNLNNYPLQYADKEMRLLLEKRGRTFWSLRNRRFVSYLRSDEDELHNVEDRYMVDTKAYKMLFPNSKIARLQLRNRLSATIMARDEPPEEGNALLVAPSTIMAHNLQEKQWRELLVDRVTDIVWNKQAFEDLVAEPETKELVQALVMKRINAKKSTDFVAGKGNGLIMLLHGAPGTGKTFTAEGVAEFAEKPLLRVTCGDVGTDAEIVDQRLRATFQLGRLWDCVVLLDEADVFLEERDMKDLKRNALVSVFLRALEYYDGILILTSNRVGTFDEAFKSRIQLALHYENLGVIQRRKIWRNFIERMRTLEEYSDRDLDEILDHIEELGREPMNGREIRNVITIARQLAQFRGPQERFGYPHLEHAIKVASRFSRYLKDMRMDLTDDMIKQDNGIRFSYTVVPAGLE
ncbi:hypothetical protein AA0112_g10195 [Alternaria arborescens]|uniref:hypothetical protein n=1 Tax=Alternaria arborescens TaxID=156630 RepID=UPI00107500E4|nr:hypothetical protein AA0111_g11643 [Alternaria arborescens]RYN21546.1 hypothetical protein AA0112_g10195 [Alternaria arborescens]RYO15707.1 hypothetical protein AA0111_g11643 [Alternaria arborescens]